MSEAFWDRMVLLAVGVLPTLALIINARITAQVAKKVDVVHQMANNRLTEALDRIEALTLQVQEQQAIITRKEET